jgi:putative ABC transport system substrate-binding protein
MQFDQLKRREFITLLGGAVAWPLGARAQQSHASRIGVLLPGTPTSFAPRTRAFVEGLRDLGYVEGKTVASHQGNQERHAHDTHRHGDGR